MSELVMLFAHLLRGDPKLLDIAVQKLSPLHFRPQEFVFRAIWQEIVDYYQTAGKQVPAEILVSRLKRIPELRDEIETVIETLRQIYTCNIGDKAAGIVLLNDFVIDRVVRPLLQTADTARPAELVDLSNRVQSIVGSLQSARVEEAKIFSDEVVLTDRYPTGVPFVDTLLGGGYMRQACYGLIGPPGGGKTTLGCQLAISVAKQCKHVCYFSYEQSAENLMERIVACATGVPTNELNTEHGKQKRQEFAEQYAAYFHFYDMSGAGGSTAGTGGVQEIIAILNSVPYHPEMVVIDWYWLVVVQSLRNRQSERTHALNIIKALHAYARDNDITIWILHQSNAEAWRRRPKDLPSANDSAEFKGLAWLISGLLVLGNPDLETQVRWLLAAKMRGNIETPAIPIKLDPLRCIFRSVQHEYEPGRYGENGFIKIGSGHGYDVI